MYNIMAKLWLLGLGFVLTPYIMRKVGVAPYGIWAVISVLLGTFGLFDLGIRTSFIKFISEYRARDDMEGINEVVNTGFCYYSIFGLIILGIAVLMQRPFFHLFHITPLFHREALFAYHGVMIVFVLECALRPYGSVIEGLQRYDVKTRIEIGLSFCYVVAILILLGTGHGFTGMVIATLGRIAAESILSLFAGFALLPALRFNPWLARTRRFKMMFAFGARLQVARWAEEIVFQVDKLIVGAFLSMDMVAYYQLGSNLCNRLRTIPGMLFTPVFPHTSDLNSRREHARIAELYRRLIRYDCAFAMPVFAFLFFRADQIISAWMGPGFGTAATIVRILSFSYALNCIAGAASTIAAGIGAVHLIMRGAILVAILNLSLCILLAIPLGFSGVATGTSLSLLIATFFFWRWFHREIGLPLFRTIAPLVIRPLAAVVLSGAAVLLIDRVTRYPWDTTGRFAALSLLAGQFFFFLSFSGLLLLCMRYFDETDLAMFRSALRIDAFCGKDDT